MLLEIDNRWIVPYYPLLSHAFKAHINVEFVNSVRASSMSANDTSREATAGHPEELGRPSAGARPALHRS